MYSAVSTPSRFGPDPLITIPARVSGNAVSRGLTEDRIQFRAKRFKNFLRCGRQPQTRYNRTGRHEWLEQYIIETIEEAQDHAAQLLWTYNNRRSNMGIGGITPAQKLKMAA